jgi:hypothetical protein
MQYNIHFGGGFLHALLLLLKFHNCAGPRAAGGGGAGRPACDTMLAPSVACRARARRRRAARGAAARPPAPGARAEPVARGARPYAARGGTQKGLRPCAHTTEQGVLLANRETYELPVSTQHHII